MAKIIITNNTTGNHPPEKWAVATAEEIFDTSSMVAGDRTILAQKFQLAIAEALAPHHTKLQDNEKTRLKDDVSYIHSMHDASEYLDDVVKDITKAAKGTPWEAHFAKPDVQDAIKNVVYTHMASSMHVERLCHADKNPACAVSKSYKVKYNVGV